MPDVLFKHTGSIARDAWISYEIEWESKVIRVSMVDHAGNPFFSSSHLQDFVFSRLARDAGINVVVDDAACWLARRPEWTVMVTVGAVEYEARFNKLILGREVCIELWPLKNEGSSPEPLHVENCSSKR